jgi:hypothetical protein
MSGRNSQISKFWNVAYKPFKYKWGRVDEDFGSIEPNRVARCFQIQEV